MHNPTCGDELVLSGVIEHSRLISIAQHSEGCIISRASASIMTELVLENSLDQIQVLAAMFVSLINGHNLANQELLQQAMIFSGVGQFPMRTKCALLPWQALVELVEGDKQ